MTLESPIPHGVVGFWVPSCGTPTLIAQGLIQVSLPELLWELAGQEQATVTEVTREVRPLETRNESPQTL